MDTNWTSPGGTYVVPPDFRARFLAEFPTYRIRWSLAKSNWLIEQRCGRGALPPTRVDPFDDSLIRARDGYWLVMATQPGDRMACPHDGATLKVAFRKAAESVCANCKAHNRDGRFMAGYWPFDEILLETLRFSDPLRGGIIRASRAADVANQKLLVEAESKRRNATTSLDAVDWRWISGIPTAGRTRRQFDSKDLEGF